MPSWLTAADLFNSDGYYRRREKEAELSLRKADIETKWQIARDRYEQSDRHHADKMALDEARLDFDRQNANLQLERDNLALAFSKEQHRDKMGLASQELTLEGDRFNFLKSAKGDELALGRDQFNLLKATKEGELALGRDQFNFLKVVKETELSLGRDQLEFQKDQADLSARVSLESAKLQTETAIVIADKQAETSVAIATFGHEAARDLAILGNELSRDLAALEHDAARDLATLEHDHAADLVDRQAEATLTLANTNHQNAMEIAREQTHLKIMEAAGLQPYEMASSELRRGEEHSRAMSGAIADILRENNRAKVSGALEAQKQAHELELVKLQAELAGGSLSEAEFDALSVRFENWKKKHGRE